VGGFGALLLKSDNDLATALVDQLEALHGIVDVGAGAGRLGKLVQDQAGDFLDQLEDEFGFLKDARHRAKDALGAVKDVGDDGLDAVKDVGGNAKDAVEDLF